MSKFRLRLPRLLGFGPAAAPAVSSTPAERESTPKPLTPQQLWAFEADKIWDEFQAEKLRLFGSAWIDPEHPEYKKLWLDWWQKACQLEEKYIESGGDIHSNLLE